MEKLIKSDMTDGRTGRISMPGQKLQLNLLVIYLCARRERRVPAAAVDNAKRQRAKRRTHFRIELIWLSMPKWPKEQPSHMHRTCAVVDLGNGG